MELFINILLFIGGSQGLLLSAALISVKRGNRKANRILAILLLLFSFLILSYAIGHQQEHRTPSYIHRWLVHAILFTIGPLLFFYCRALTRPDLKLRLVNAFHFIPAILSAIAILSFGNFFYSRKLTFFVDTVFLILIVIQVAGYLISMFFMMKRYMLTIKDTYSSLEKLNLHWLRFIFFSQAVIWPVALMIDIHWQKTGHIGFIWLLISAFIYIIGYIGLLKPEIFSGGFQEAIFSEHSGKKKYEKSTLTQEQAEIILKKLQSFMQSSKPYINPTLTLPALSKDLNFSPNYLSQVINERLNKNFFEFVNSYRVEEAKLLIRNPSKQHLTLAAIGFEAGFNSVSSFNKIFKETTSCTPSQFKLSEYPK